MKIIITESQHNLLIETIVNDNEFRNLIKKYESTVINSKNQHYTFDDKDPNQKKKFVTTNKPPYGGTLTIGWGHTGEHAKPGNIISNNKAEQLLTKDIQKHEELTKKIFPKLDKYPTYVQRALVNTVYRGEAKTNYKWVKSVNNNNWTLAAKQYLEGWNIDFSKVGNPTTKGSVAERMKNNQLAFLKYAKELNPTKNIGSNKGIYHTVKSGETLSSIASKYDKTITVATIIKLNKLKTTTLQVGQKLKIK
jgi:GH24 family phage-related lysozyme (muramidase)